MVEGTADPLQIISFIGPERFVFDGDRRVDDIGRKLGVGKPLAIPTERSDDFVD